jgi:peptidyl-Lys metalloendopeptidase
MERWRQVSISIPLLALLALPAAAQLKAADVRLEPGLAKAGAEGSGQLRFTLVNRSPRAVQVLVWGTPLEGILGPIFELTCNGVNVPYRGPVVKREAPADRDYVEIGPGASKAATVNLAAAYDVGRDGACRVRWRGEVRVREAAAGRRRAAGDARISLATDELVLSLTARTADTLSPSFKGCDAAQERTLRATVPVAQTLATTAKRDLEAVPVSERDTFPRYAAWFGAYTAERYDGMIGLYRQVNDAIDGGVTFDCTGTGSCSGIPATCQPSWFAFTCAGGGNGTIWPCGAFWRAPASGADSQPGTIVHELSHWFDRWDFVYGCNDCQGLAQRNPTQAVHNADNCEYFAENFGITCP